MASAHTRCQQRLQLVRWCSCSSLVLGPDGQESGPLQRYNLLLELTSLEYPVIDTDTWRYEDGEHSATPPFSVLGVAPEQYVSHDRRAQCHTEKQLRVYPNKLYADGQG